LLPLIGGVRIAKTFRAADGQQFVSTPELLNDRVEIDNQSINESIN